MRCFNPFCTYKVIQSGPFCKRCGQYLRLGSFFASELITEGSFASIYLLQNQQNTQYVLKTPNSSVLEYRNALSVQNTFLKKEAAILQSLKEWRGAPRIKHFGKWGEWYYLIEEYIRGPTLKEVAGVSFLSEHELWILLDTILELLEHLAQQGIVHRDLKPDNLILTEMLQRPLVLIDWGLSSSLEQNWEPRLGNLDFAAPEVLQGHSSLKSDLYSLGKLMIYLLLLNSHEVNAMWSSHVPHLSSELIEVINHLWLHRRTDDARAFREIFVPLLFRTKRHLLTQIARNC